MNDGALRSTFILSSSVVVMNSMKCPANFILIVASPYPAGVKRFRLSLRTTLTRATSSGWIFAFVRVITSKTVFATLRASPT